MRNSPSLFFIVFVVSTLVCSLAVSAVLFAKQNSSSDTIPQFRISVEKGEGLQDIAKTLYDIKLIRSQGFFKFFAFMTGRAHLLKPGEYVFREGIGTFEIISQLAEGPSREVEVVIPEGFTLYDIDAELALSGVLAAGSLRALDKKMPGMLEGYLFPDTYRFYLNSTTTDVLQKMSDNFDGKARPLLEAATRGDKKKFQRALIIASLIEKEIPGGEDRRIVAGIIEKRLGDYFPLQIDATICYIKQKRSQTCEPIYALDLKIDSPYNTYLYRGLPPAPISNPGLDAIYASLNPVVSPYWYYLSDPKTKKTIFSKTLEEHRENRAKYLTQ